ncbi:MAG: TRAP transporter permease DctM/Q, partial [Pseudomonadota bacterium]
MLGAKAGRPWVVLGLVVILFHLGLTFSGLVPNLVARPVHMALALPFVLVLGQRSAVGRLSGIVLAAVGVAACLWIVASVDALADQYGFIEGDFQTGAAVVLLLVTLEAARRAIGWPLPLVALLALLYGLFGQHIPGEFGHSGTPLPSFLGTLVIAEGGLWGSL